MSERDEGQTAGPAARASQIDWPAVESELDAQGWAVIPNLLSAAECDGVARAYGGPAEAFRSRVVMARHGFGRGEYRYFSYPLPPLVQEMRSALYRRVAGLANQWNDRMKIELRFPKEHGAFLERCHAGGQTLPTPLLLEYGAGDYNRLHQDLYGEHVFPLQVATLLSQPGRDFSGGEFILTEQRPRMQTRAMVVPLAKGDGVVFAVNCRPQRGSRGDYRVIMRHGVSRVASGHRRTLGIIFHDAR